MITLDFAAAADLPEIPDLDGAFPRFDQAQLALLEADGETRSVRPGDVLYTEGEPSRAFYVIRTGRVAMVEDYGADEQRVVGCTGPVASWVSTVCSPGSPNCSRRWS